MITIGGFSGEIPKAIPRLLPDSAAQIAKNCKLIDGSIMPLRYPADYRQLAPGNVMFYKRGDTWLEWNEIVDVAQSSTALNRLYITGDGVPKVVVDSVVYPLALAPPASPLVATLRAAETTAALNYNASAADVQAALVAITAIGAGNVVCTGGPLPATPIKVTFQGLLTNRMISALTVADNSLSGGSGNVLTVDHTMPGTSNNNDTQTISVLGAPTAGTFKFGFNAPDPQTQADFIYTYTYVTALDEESEPADVSNSVLRSPGMDVTLSGFVAPPTTRNYNRIRIYRSQTSTSGATDFYFIKEIYLPVPTPNWLDIVEQNPIQEPIPSISYNPPPDDLQGIVELPNGMMAAFTGRKVYFCEPYRPHAWPEKYVLTTNFDIVGLGAFGHTLVVLTKGQPYVITGIEPDQMAMDKVEVNYPCVNKRGIVDLGFAVAYPSTDGLVTISGNGAALATRDTITREKWQQMSPETIIAAQYEGRYVASYSYSDPSGATSTGTIVIDLTGEQPFISRVDSYYPFMFFEVGAGKLFVLNGRIAQEWDSIVSPFMSMTWRSKKFVQSAAINFGCALIDGEELSVGYQGSALPTVNIDDAFFVNGSEETGAFGTPPAEADVPFQATVYADGAAVRSFTDLNKPSRLPGGFLARTWEIEVTGIRMITAIYLAWSPSELATAGGAQ